LAFFLAFFDLFFVGRVFGNDAIGGVTAVLGGAAETTGAAVFERFFGTTGATVLGGAAETTGAAVFGRFFGTTGATVLGGAAETTGATVLGGFFGTGVFWGEIVSGVTGTSGVNPSSTPA